MPSHHFTGWLSTEVLPRHSKLAERAKLGTWFEQRARLIEAADHKPHNALQLLTLLDVGCQMSDGRGVGTPKEYVEYAVARAATASYSTFGARACLSHRVAAGLRQQLEDMVFLWVC